MSGRRLRWTRTGTSSSWARVRICAVWTARTSGLMNTRSTPFILWRSARKCFSAARRPLPVRGRAPSSRPSGTSESAWAWRTKYTFTRQPSPGASPRVKGYGRTGSMRGPWLLMAFLCVAAAACRRPPGTGTPVDAGLPAAAAPDAGLQLTLSKLDGFLAYERLLRGEPVPSAREVRRLSQAADGGVRALEEAYAGLQRRSERAQALRVDAGLTAAEVQALESLTAEVALARA